MLVYLNPNPNSDPNSDPDPDLNADSNPNPNLNLNRQVSAFRVLSRWGDSPISKLLGNNPYDWVTWENAGEQLAFYFGQLRRCSPRRHLCYDHHHPPTAVTAARVLVTITPPPRHRRGTAL